MLALSNRSRGILQLIAAVSCLAAVDGFTKILIGAQSFGQIMFARFGPALLVLLVVTGPRNWGSLFATQRHGLQILRGLAPVFVGGLMVLAVGYLPLAEATVILYAGPFIVVALSGWMLGERVDASSWIAVAIGFLAVLVVSRPGFSALSAYTIFPALAALFYALLQLLSRRLGAAGEKPSTTFAWTFLVGTIVSLPLALLDWRSSGLGDWIAFFCLAMTYGLGQHFLVRAFALAPASVLTPFSYCQILAAAIFGAIAFHSFPDVSTCVGMIMIIAAGTYAFTRKAAQ